MNRNYMSKDHKHHDSTEIIRKANRIMDNHGLHIVPNKFANTGYAKSTGNVYVNDGDEIVKYNVMVLTSKKEKGKTKWHVYNIHSNRYNRIDIFVLLDSYTNEIRFVPRNIFVCDCESEHARWLNGRYSRGKDKGKRRRDNNTDRHFIDDTGEFIDNYSVFFNGR